MNLAERTGKSKIKNVRKELHVWKVIKVNNGRGTRATDTVRARFEVLVKNFTLRLVTQCDNHGRAQIRTLVDTIFSHPAQVDIS